MDNSIVPAHLAVKAMRDNGYKNAAYAIAELMDNSIQHEATKVELLCAEIEVTIKLRIVSRINKIAVLDNGSGMDGDVLRMALQFGNGTHLNPDKQKGIGKFGMGLPSSSISQAKRVEVWTWQDGIENALYSYLDLDEIINETLKSVPIPEIKPIPDLWKTAGKAFSRSGTLVVWSNIDRCIWKTAQAIIDNSELIIGRMYRKFLQGNKVDIRMVSFKENNPSQLTYVRQTLPNDPIYLIDKTSCPEPFSNTAMFNKWGDESYEVQFKVPYKGEDHEIFVRFSIAKEDARKGYLPGAKPHGKHAGKNIGVSVVRADRELELNQSWVNGYDPRERWWGIEVDFPPALDEVFGVTNNKQFANNFTDLGKMDIDELLTDGKTLVQLKEELEDENDPKALLIEIAQRINKNLGAIRTAIRDQARNLEREEKTRHASPENTAEQVATEATEERKKDGHIGTSDKQEQDKPEEERKIEVEKTLEQEGVTNAKEVASRLFSSNLKYQFVDSDFESHAFFTVKPKGGKIIIALNTNHPAYHKLVEVLDKDTEGVDADELRDRLINASDGLKLLFMAWARYEDEQPDGDKKSISQNTRMDWGRIAKEFLKEE